MATFVRIYYYKIFDNVLKKEINVSIALTLSRLKCSKCHEINNSLEERHCKKLEFDFMNNTSNYLSTLFKNFYL